MHCSCRAKGWCDNDATQNKYIMAHKSDDENGEDCSDKVKKKTYEEKE